MKSSPAKPAKTSAPRLPAAKFTKVLIKFGKAIPTYGKTGSDSQRPVKINRSQLPSMPTRSKQPA
jgi:hypothetical protein